MYFAMFVFILATTLSYYKIIGGWKIYMDRSVRLLTYSSTSVGTLIIIIIIIMHTMLVLLLSTLGGVCHTVLATVVLCIMFAYSVSSIHTS